MSNFGKLNPFKIIILGFAGLILTGTLLLSLPISTAEGVVTPFTDCLFTATSATCVTGLVVYDTGTYWSVFGQAVILILIQIGGMGVITFAMLIAIMSGRKISLNRRSIMQSSVSASRIGGILKLTGFIFTFTLIMERVGAAAAAPVFCSDYGILKGLWVRVFHSISAFCNAGFDILGASRSASLSAYSASPVINIVTMSLIVIGGLGYVTWNDIFSNRKEFSRLSLQTRAVISASFFLIVIPALYNYFFEFNHLYGAERVFASLFQSVTTRTAGFSSVNVGGMSEAGQSLMIPLMLIGGSPGSTAGGMKTTTLLCLVLHIRRIMDPKKGFSVLSRRIEDETVHTAVSLAVVYISLFFLGGMFMRTVERMAMLDCLFESASALGTVGLTTGITPIIRAPSKIVLIMLMFIGRTGGLSVLYAASGSKFTASAALPAEDLMVG